MIPSQHPSAERKSSVNSSTSPGSTERKSSVGDISSLSDLLKKKKKDARRAEIVAAVTKRLYSARKKVEVKPEPVEKVPEQEDNPDDAEPDELKLCQRARARLQELSKKALHAQRSRMRRFSDVEAQTDFDAHVVRVKEVAVSTEELYCGPHMSFIDNRRLLFTSYAYTSMRQEPAWSSVSIRNHNKPNEDSFSDDSLDSTHGLDTTEEEKPSLWNVISISSGKQFKSNGVDTKNDQMFRYISTQTQASSHEKDVRYVQTILDTEPDNCNICSQDIVSPKQMGRCEYDCTDQPAEATKFNQVSSCLHKDTQQQADSYICRCETSDMDTGIITERTSLQLSDHHLYTITENSEHSDSNDVTSGDNDNSSISQRSVTLPEKFENTPSVTVCSPDTCSFRTIRSALGPCQLHACESYRSFPLPDIMTYPHISCCEACTTHIKHNHGWQRYEDKMSQTTPEFYMHSTKESTCMLQKNTIQTTADTDSNRHIRKRCQNGATLYGINRTCKHCNIQFIHSYDTDDGIKLLPTQSTKTKGTQYALTHLPVHVGTQTEITQMPNMTVLCSALLGAYPQLMQLSSPTLQLENCMTAFFPGHMSQPITLKPIQWSSSNPSDTVGVQTDENREHRTMDEKACCSMKSQIDNDLQSNGPASQRREGAESTSTCQSACSQSTSQQTTNRQIIPEPCSERSQPRSRAGINTSTSVSFDSENFSDDEDAPCLPSGTVNPQQGTEASGYQHWSDIKSLILGTDNVFPYNITTEEEDCPVQQTKDIKKKSVSWSDLSGCGALHTEMVFASDHNLFDSTHIPPNKITKNSLLNVISNKPWRPALER
jgi:hypothetical protein